MKLKTKIWLIGLGIIVLLGITGGIYGLVSKKPTTTSNQTTLPKENLTKKLEPKLVWEKEFEHEIEDASLENIPKDGSELPIIRVITTKDIFLFDKKGNMVRRLPSRDGIEVSENGRYVMEYISTEKEWFLNYRYTTWKGKLLWEKKNIFDDGCAGVLTGITPQGDRIIMVGDDGAYPESHPGVWFYDKKGKIIKGYSYKELRYSSNDGVVVGSEGVGGDISGDGKLFILVYGDETQKGRFRVILFDKNGKILWEREIQVREDIYLHHRTYISFHSETICIEILTEMDDIIYIYNKKGDLIRKLEKEKGYNQEYCQDFILSPKGDFLIMVFPSFIVLIDIASGREIKRLNLEVQRPYLAYESITISPNNNLVAIKEKDKLYLITNKGNVLSQQNQDMGGKREYIFSKDSRFLFMSVIKDKILTLYRMEVGGLK